VTALVFIVLFATPTQAARVHFERAQSLFKQEEYRQALDEFAAANESSDREVPDLYFNIAQCLRNLGQPRQAAIALERYLSLRPDAPDRNDVRELIARLRVNPPATAPVTTVEAEPSVPVPEERPVAEKRPAAASSSTDAPTPTTARLPLARPVLAPLPPPPRARHRLTARDWIGIGVGTAGAVGLSLALGLGLGLATGAPGMAHTSVAPTTSMPMPGLAAGPPMLGSAGTFDTRSR
jgi:tetratricopeptide (TPR) repeat protein